MFPIPNIEKQNIFLARIFFKFFEFFEEKKVIS